MSIKDDNIPLADDDPQGNFNKSIDLLSNVIQFVCVIFFAVFSVIIEETNDNFNRAKSSDSLPSMYNNDGSSSSLEPDINPDEQEEKARLISQVLELQNTLDGKRINLPNGKLDSSIHVWVFCFRSITTS